MNATLEWLKVNAKAVVGFLVGLILNAVLAVINGQAPWPTSLADWGKYLGTAIVTGVLVWATGNKLSVPQIIAGAAKAGVSVVTNEAIDATAKAASNAVTQATAPLPGVIGGPVNQVAKTVEDTVTSTLKDWAANFPGLPDLSKV